MIIELKEKVILREQIVEEATKIDACRLTNKFSSKEVFMPQSVINHIFGDV